MTYINRTRLSDLKKRQPAILLEKLHRPMYRACLELNPKKAEEVRQLVLRQYGIDLATEAR